MTGDSLPPAQGSDATPQHSQSEGDVAAAPPQEIMAPAALAAAIQAGLHANFQSQLGFWDDVDMALAAIFAAGHIFLREALHQLIALDPEGYQESLLNCFPPSEKVIYQETVNVPLTKNEAEPAKYYVHLAQVQPHSRHAIRMKPGQARAQVFLSYLKQVGQFLFEGDYMRMRMPPADDAAGCPDLISIEPDKGMLRCAMLHLVAYVAVKTKHAVPATLMQSMTAIPVLTIEVTSEEDRFALALSTSNEPTENNILGGVGGGTV